ncbi:MAG TPA: TonB-dependent receptor plug domain-containing protein [Myxococcales bacterium LLY-WYZ-16_1]|nr:TonB-dependent receptor plug domain-containing protein [Myxococcales bacterium LLY-WYZ-16_1]
MRVRYAVWGFISGLSLWPLPGSVRAQPDPSHTDGATSTATSAEPTLDVVDIRAPERREGPLVPPADSRIPLSGRTVRYETLGQVLLEVPGVHIFRTGGVGRRQSLSIRGSEFDQVVVLIDDVPLIGPDRGPVDFGAIPLDGFERVEVFYDSAPIRWGGGTIGGVVRLVPAQSPSKEAQLEAGAGSFDTYRGRVQARGSTDRFGGTLSGGYLRSDNDFFFVDDAGTLLGPEPADDDVIRRRQNAQIERGDGFAYGTWDFGVHRLALLGWVVHQEAGAPGTALQPSTESDEVRTRAFGSLGYRLRTAVAGRGLDVFATLALGWDRLRFRDPLGRIGQLREDSRDLFTSFEGRTGAFFQVTPWMNLGATVFHRWDDLQPNDALAMPAVPPSSRHTTTIASEVSLAEQVGDVPVSLRASVSGTFTRAEIANQRLMGIESSVVDESAPFFRVEAGAQPIRGLRLSSKVSSGIRLPTSLELFGDRNTIQGAFDLEPERSVTVDGRARYGRKLGPMDLVVDAALFWRRVDDLILARRTSQFQIAFENARDGEVVGTQLQLDVGLFGVVRATGNFTWQDASFDNRGFSRQQPLRVPLRLWSRLGVTPPLAPSFVQMHGFVELDHRSGFFPDSANLVEQPSFTSWNAGVEARFWEERLIASVVGSNLTDARGIDLLGFPLMSRFVQGSIRWRVEL